MIMLVELSDDAVADELAEEEVDELVRELEIELDLLEVAEDVANMEELVETLDAVDEGETELEDDSDEAVEELDLLLERDADDDEAAKEVAETTFAFADTARSLFLEGNPPTKKAESTMYERSVVLLIGLLDCALLR